MKEDDIPSKIDRDKKEMEKITSLLKVVTEEEDDIGIEEFTRLGRYEPGKTRPLKVVLQTSNMVEIILRNVKKIKQSEQWKHIWVNRCLTREDRDKLREKVQEAKPKNKDRSPEEEAHFFYKVTGMQVKKMCYRTREDS